MYEVGISIKFFNDKISIAFAIDKQYILLYVLLFRNIKSVAPADGKSKIGLLGEYDPQGGRIIDDPYYVSK